MKAFRAIFTQTIRSAMRSKVFIVLFALILIAVIGLPLTIKGDNTASGLVQISLTYSLNVVIALISASALWLGCSLLATEVESYNIHLIVVKPCPRWVLWLGKWCGIVVMHTIILVVSMLIIYGLTNVRLASAQRSGLFSEEEMAKLNRETLVGRRSFYPQPVDLGPLVEKEYQKRLSQNTIDTSADQTLIKKAIEMELIEGVMRNITLAPGEERSWVYPGVAVADDNAQLYLRFRIYTGDISDTDQRQMAVDLGLDVYQDAEGNPLPASAQVPVVWYSSLTQQPFMHPGGSWQELSTVTKEAKALEVMQLPVLAKQVISTDGTVKLTLRNLGDMFLPDASTIPAGDEKAQKSYAELVSRCTCVMQVVDGPSLQTPVTGFFNNFLRAMLMAIFLIFFLAALGSTVGAVFSTPVAVFAAISYIVIGLVVPAAVDAPLTNPDGSYQYKHIGEQAAHGVARAVQWVVVTVDDLDCTGHLAAGRLIELGDIGKAFVKVLLFRTGLITLLGIWVLHRRELGLVVRKL